MCWVSKEINKRVAEEDKIVYKKLIPVSFREARSPVYTDHIYIKDKVCPTVNIKLEISEAGELRKIEEGYHSYTSPHPKMRAFIDKLLNFIYGTFGRIFSKNL